MPLPALRLLGRLLLVPGVALSLLPTGLAARQSPDPGSEVVDRPRVFLDCSGPRCDSRYYRTEIGWVDWVLDRRDGDVHLIITSLSTGAGGREFQLDFLGVEGYEGYRDQVTYTTLPTDTEREEFDGLVHVIEVGLARFANHAGLRGLVEVRPLADTGGAGLGRMASPGEVDDPWNLWVFRVNGSLNLDGEETRETRRMNGSFNAARVTPTWKMNFRGRINYNRRQIELTDQPDFVNTQTDWSFNQLVVYSVAEHWSVGLRGEVGRVVRANQRFRWEFTPALEYSFFPYEEANRQSLTAFYQIGPAHRDYIEETVFGETAETRFEQALEVEFAKRQPWGDAWIRLRGSHFLHDLDLYNVSMRGNLDFRVVRGLNLRAQGNVAWVQDQIYLSGEGASSEEELLNLVLRGQSFNYGMELGFSFQFGSVFNNVVNNRFSG
jgi:hypothetical protein